jgi:hypothetical protein
VGGDARDVSALADPANAELGASMPDTAMERCDLGTGRGGGQATRKERRQVGARKLVEVVELAA